MDSTQQASGGSMTSWMPAGVSASGVPSYPKEAQRVLALNAIGQNVASANENLSGCVNELRDLADSVFGPQPPSNGEAMGVAPHMGRIDGLSQSVQSTHEMIRLLRSQIERFRSL